MSRFCLPPLRAALILLLLLLASACMYGPENGQTLPSTSSVVTFRGYAVSPGRPVEIWSSARRQGAFRIIASARSSTQATTFPDGAKLYHWEVTGVVPGWSETCTNREAFVKAVVDRGEQYTFDAVNAAGKTPLQCLQEAVAAGRSTVAAIEECKSPDSPVVRLQVAGTSLPVNRNGDLTIRSESAAIAYRCLQSVNGNLTITDVPVDIALPHLQTVSGDLLLDYTVPDGPVGEVAQARRIQLPALTSVGRDLALQAFGAPSQTYTTSVELHALSSVGRNVNVYLDGNSRTTGQLSLTTIPGSLAIRRSQGFALPRLQSVGADVSLKDFANTGLPALRTVGGDLDLVDITMSDQLPALESISGRARLAGIQFLPANGQSLALPSLAKVGEELFVSGFYPIDSDRDLTNHLSAIVPSGAYLGGLWIWFGAMESLDGVTFNVDPQGEVQFRGNGQLCESLIHAWIDQLPGWSGTRRVDNNKIGC